MHTMTDDELIDVLRAGADASGLTASTLCDRIERLIESGDLEHGRRLPTERNLADALGISRPTVRNALAGLERLGMAYRRQGSGTYVNSAPIEGNLRVLSGFSDELSPTAHRVTTRVLQFGFAAPTTTVQRELEIDDNAMSAVRLVRVRSLDEVPSTYEVSWMPASIGGHLVGTDLTNKSLFRLLAETRDIHPDHATEKLRVAAMDTDEASVLDSKPGAPAFLVNRTTFDKAGTPIEYAHTILRGDRFFYSTTLEAPCRLPAAAEQLSRFETLASDT